jgi:hypothetical protein
MILFYVTYCALIYWIFADILIHTTDFCNALLLEDSSTNYEMKVCLQPCQAILPGTQANRPEVHMVSTISYSANSPVESTIHGLHLYTYGM